MKKPEPTRREVLAQRRAESAHDGEVSAQSYRRNRTLNSREASSPMETSDRLEAHKLVKRRRILVRRLLGVLVGLIIILVLLYQLTISISIQTPDSHSAMQSEKYKSVLDEYYAARPAERFRFFLNHSNLAAFFLEKAPEVKNVRVEGDFLARSTVKLTFRQPVAQWSSNDKIYFVDENGVTFERNYFDSPTVAVKDESGIPTQGGQEVINRRFLSFLGQAVSAFSRNNVTVSEVILPANNVRQVWFRLDGSQYDIKMTVDREAGAQVKQAIITIEQLRKRGETPSYIDVRVDQRSFYR